MTDFNPPWLLGPLNQLGVPVIESSALAPGQIIYGTDLAPNLDSMTIFAHPMAMIWLTYANESNEFIHRKTMEWIEQNLDRRVQEAEDRLDQMVAEMNAGTWGKKVVGVIHEGPLAGSLAYQNDDGTYTAGKGRTIEEDAFLTHSRYFLPVITPPKPIVVVSGG